MEKIRRCDDRCHNAKGKVCKCWCNGRYHGISRKKANELFVKDHYWAKDVKEKVLVDDVFGEHVAFNK